MADTVTVDGNSIEIKNLDAFDTPKGVRIKKITLVTGGQLRPPQSHGNIWTYTPIPNGGIYNVVQALPDKLVFATTKDAPQKPPTGANSGSKGPQKPPEPKWTSAGGVVLQAATLEGINKVLVVYPKNAYGGYKTTFPKGRVDAGENLVTTAKREVKEETGIDASLLPNGYLGVAEGTSSFTHYYMMVRVSGEPGGAGTDGESAKVEWVSWSQAFHLFAGSSRDRAILLKAWDYVRKLRKKLD